MNIFNLEVYIYLNREICKNHREKFVKINMATYVTKLMLFSSLITSFHWYFGATHKKFCVVGCWFAFVKKCYKILEKTFTSMMMWWQGVGIDSTTMTHDAATTLWISWYVTTIVGSHKSISTNGYDCLHFWLSKYKIKSHMSFISCWSIDMVQWLTTQMPLIFFKAAFNYNWKGHKHL